MTREEAIQALKDLADMNVRYGCDDKWITALHMAIEALQEVQKHEETFEWCHDCKEYDTENYCCHRWSKTIRNTVEELKAETHDIRWKETPNFIGALPVFNDAPSIPTFAESAEAYKAWTGEEMGGDEINDMNKEIIKDILKMMPTAYLLEALGVSTFEELTEQADRPHGEWYQIKDHKIMGEGYLWHCSICDYKVYQDSSKDYPTENYCPNCGALMLKGGDSE